MVLEHHCSIQVKMIWYYWLVVATVLVNCINRNTHDGNEYAKCLVSGTSYNGMNEIGSVTYNVSQLFIV
jgi:hypothetical protein